MKPPESPATGTETRVWDPLVRLFHWSLVAAFAVAWLTADEEPRWHELSGYVVIALVASRIVWGFIGTRYARFSDFVYPPAVVWSYVRDLLAGRARRYLGHNPLGGVMVVALLAALLATGVSGLALQDAEQGAGPFAPLASGTVVTIPDVIPGAMAGDDDDKGRNGKEENEGKGEWWEELHEFCANLTLLLVALHIAGVIVGGLAHRENLVRAMFTGRKPD